MSLIGSNLPRQRLGWPRVKAHGEQVLKQFGTPTAAVKDNGEVPTRPQEFAYFAQHGYKHSGHSGVGIGSYHEQGIAALIIDPIIGACRWSGASIFFKDVCA